MPGSNNQRPFHFVLIRGLARCHCHWGDFPEKLSTSFPECKISFIDLPGSGGRNHVDFSLKMIHNTESVRRDFKEIQSSFEKDYETFVIGISLGGIVALSWAKEYPQDFNKMLIINSSVADCNILYRLQPYAFRVLSKAIVMIDDLEREKSIFKLTSSLKLDEKIVKEWANCSRKFHMSKENVFRQLLAASRFKCPKSLTQKLLILCSRKDKLCDYRCSFTIHDILPNSDLELHASAGHDLPLDDPDWTIEKIQRFLSA